MVPPQKIGDKVRIPRGLYWDYIHAKQIELPESGGEVYSLGKVCAYVTVGKALVACNYLSILD